jgi:hypothetical protein
MEEQDGGKLLLDVGNLLFELRGRTSSHGQQPRYSLNHPSY